MQAITAHLANRHGQTEPWLSPLPPGKPAPIEWMACPRPNARVGVRVQRSWAISQSLGSGEVAGAGVQSPRGYC